MTAVLLRCMGLKVRLWKGVTEDLEAQAEPAVPPPEEESSSSVHLSHVPAGKGASASFIQLNLFPHFCAKHGVTAIASRVADILAGTLNITVGVVAGSDLSSSLQTNLHSVVQDAKGGTLSIIRE